MYFSIKLEGLGTESITLSFRYASAQTLEVLNSNQELETPCMLAAPGCPAGAGKGPEGAVQGRIREGTQAEPGVGGVDLYGSSVPWDRISLS